MRALKEDGGCVDCEEVQEMEETNTRVLWQEPTRQVQPGTGIYRQLHYTDLLLWEHSQGRLPGPQ